MEKKPSVNEKLDQCIGTLEEIRNSGYWPFVSPAPCSTESKIKEAINEALRQLRNAKANHEQMFGHHGRSESTPPAITIQRLK